MASEKENLQDPSSHVQQLSLPALKSQVPKKAPLSLLTLSRRPLRDTVNLQASNVNSVVVAEDPKNGQECVTLSEGSSLKNAGAAQPLSNVTVTGSAVGNVRATQAGASGNKKEGNGNCGENIREPSPPMEDDLAGVSSHRSALDAPNESWLKPKANFFPSIHECSEMKPDSNAQVGLQSSHVRGSHQQVAESLVSSSRSLKQFFKSEHRKCLTPIREMSPLKEGDTARGGEGDMTVEKTAPLFQSFFAQECATVIDNIRRTSLQGAGRQSCARSCLDNLEVTGIEAESLPDWTGLNSTLEWSCSQPEKEAPRSDAGSCHACPGSKEEVVMSEKKAEEVQDVSESSSFSSKDGFVSMVMGKTHSIHESFLKDTHILSDNSSGRGKTFEKSDSENTNGTYVLHGGNPEAARNVTVNLTDPKMFGSAVAEADSGRSRSRCNNTYELHPVAESERKEGDGVVLAEEDGLMDTNSGSENGHLAGSICKHNMDAGERAALNGLNLDDSLDFKDSFLVTSTPMPQTKGFHFTEEPDTTVLEDCEQHSAADAVAGRSKGDTVTLGGADGSISASLVRELPAVNVKDVKKLPKAATIVLRRRPSASFSRPSEQRKGLLPSSAARTSARTRLPSTQPPATRRTSLPAAPQKTPQLSVAATPLLRLSTPFSFGKRSEGVSISSSKGLKTASSSEAPAASGERRPPATEAKASTVSALQKPRASGLPACTSRLGVKPRGLAVPTEGVKGRSLQQPTAAQKKPLSSSGDCSASKRRRIDAPSASAEVPKTSAKAAVGPQALRRLTKGLKDLELKPVSSETRGIINGPPKEPGRPARNAQGLRTPVAGLKVLESKVKNGSSAPPLPKSVSSLKTLPSAPEVNGDLVSSSEDVPTSIAVATAGADAPEAALTLESQQTDCENCARYREENARLKAALLELIVGRDKKMEGGNDDA